MIKLTGNEFGVFDNTPEGKRALRSAVADFLESLKGQFVYCKAIHANVELRKRGIKKALSFSSDKRKLQALFAIKQIIAQPQLINTQQNHKTENKPQVLGYYHLAQKVQIKDKIYEFRLIIEKDQSGHLFYDLNRLVENLPEYEGNTENKSGGQHSGKNIQTRAEPEDKSGGRSLNSQSTTTQWLEDKSELYSVDNSTQTQSYPEDKSGVLDMSRGTLDNADPWHSMRLWYQKQCLLVKNQQEQAFSNFWIEE